MPGAFRNVPKPETRNFDWILERHELQQIHFNIMGRMLEPAVAPPMPGDIASGLVADRPCGRAPEIPGSVVGNIERLALRIGDRIVRPRSEMVLLAVDRPRRAASFRADLKAETRIGDNIDPRSRRRLTRTEHRYIFSP